LLTATSIDFYELHDRIILATAKWLDIPIISSDKEFSHIKGIKVIWD
jgi:predicted nucleic acid-binding protein